MFTIPKFGWFIFGFPTLNPDVAPRRNCGKVAYFWNAMSVVDFQYVDVYLIHNDDDDDDEEDDDDCKGGATSGLDGTSLKMPSISQATRQGGGELQWR